MDLLELAGAPVNQYAVSSFAPVQNWPTEGAVFDFTLMDLFGPEFNDVDFGVMDENGGTPMVEQSFI